MRREASNRRVRDWTFATRHDWYMINAARRRAPVALADGRQGRLFGWKIEAAWCRVEIDYPAGPRRFNIPKTDITIIEEHHDPSEAVGDIPRPAGGTRVPPPPPSVRRVGGLREDDRHRADDA